MESKMQQTTSLSYLLSTSSQFAYEHWEISKILFLFWEMPPFTQQAKSVYTVNDSPHILVRFLGLDVSPVRRSWHSLWGFLCLWMATEPRQPSICNSIHAYWQTCPLFHPWIPSKVEVDTPSFKIRSGTPYTLASVWPQTLSFASEDNSRIAVHSAVLFLSVHPWDRDNVEVIFV